MLTATKHQKKHIYKLCEFNEDAKNQAVLSVTDGRTGSLNEIDFTEANTLIDRLGGDPHYYDNWAKFDKNNTQHMYILSLCKTYGWRAQSPVFGTIADLMKLSEWLKKDKKCPVNKKLTQMEPKELSKIIVALEGMVEWKLQQNPDN